MSSPSSRKPRAICFGWLLCLTIVSAAFAATQNAEHPKDSEAKKRAKESLELMQKLAAQYKFTRGKEGKTQLKLRAEPLLRWTNPVQGEQYGVDFIWTVDGRPELYAQFYTTYKPREPRAGVGLGFQSLSMEPIQAGKRRIRVWETTNAGVEWKPVPSAPKPADSSRQRLR